MLKTAPTSQSGPHAGGAWGPVGWALLVLAIFVSSCSTSEPETESASDATDPAASLQEQAIEKAVVWLEANMEYVDNSPTLMFIDYIGRNWSEERLSPLAHEVAKSHEPWGYSLLIWRLIDPEFPPPDQIISEPVDTQELMSAALFCDQRPLGPGFGRSIDYQTQQGGYLASHAGIALKWVLEHGCQLDSLSARVEIATSIMADELSRATVADDMHLEIGAVLVYLGREDLVPQRFVDLAVEQQHDDGGWGINGPHDPSNWHPTFLGLWMLYGVTHGEGNGAQMMPASE